MTIPLGNLPYSYSEGTVTAVIEIPQGCNQKIEYDHEHDCFVLDRILDWHYPANYGFIPGTMCEDGDALDVMVIGEICLPRGTVLRVKPVALVEMYDCQLHDPKLIAVPDCVEYPKRKDFKIITNFLKEYKAQGEVLVIERVYSHIYAKHTLSMSRDMYLDTNLKGDI